MYQFSCMTCAPPSFNSTNTSLFIKQTCITEQPASAFLVWRTLRAECSCWGDGGSSTHVQNWKLDWKLSYPWQVYRQSVKLEAPGQVILGCFKYFFGNAKATCLAWPSKVKNPTIFVHLPLQSDVKVLKFPKADDKGKGFHPNRADPWWN